MEEIRRQPLGAQILEEVDVLIAGRYVQGQHEGHGLLGSRNQRIHLLTPRHTLEEFASIPTAEIIIRPDGSISHTGIHPSKHRNG
jgi:anaerobic ribonucleoside-triphosphate reductase activating protein